MKKSETPLVENASRVDDLREIVENEVADVIKTAEDVVNDIKQLETDRDEYISANNVENSVTNATDDSLDNLESLKDESVFNAQEKSEEAFRFLDNELSSPVVASKPDFNDTALFVQREKELYSPDFEIKSSETSEVPAVCPAKSGIPISRSKQKSDLRNEKEKELDLLFALNDGRDSISPTESELLSKIPISAKGSKVKTIKKHSKDPLKEFVKLAQDVNWDDDDTFTLTTHQTDPIVKTTVTRITSEGTPGNMKTTVQTTENSSDTKSKIPTLFNEALSPSELCEKFDASSPKSKIPVLVTETTRIMSPESTRVERTVISPTSSQVVETTIVSPGSRMSTKSSTLDSDSEEDSRQSPPLQGILKKTITRTVGSSSGSDVALHEAGGELSEDDSGKFFVLLLLCQILD